MKMRHTVALTISEHPRTAFNSSRIMCLDLVIPEDLQAWVLRTEWIRDSVLKEWEKHSNVAEGDKGGEQAKNKGISKERMGSFPSRGEDVGNLSNPTEP